MGLSGGCVLVWTAEWGSDEIIPPGRPGRRWDMLPRECPCQALSQSLPLKVWSLSPLSHPVALASQPRSGTSEPISIDAEL